MCGLIAVLACVGALPAAASAAPVAVAVRLPAAADPVAELGVGARPLVTSPARARLVARAGVHRAGIELGRWWTVRQPDARTARALARRLARRPGVSAEALVRPLPPPASCRAGAIIAQADPLPDLASLQDARAALELDGLGAGAGVRVTDVEYAWTPDHREFAARSLAAPVLPPGGLPPRWRSEDHGDAVLATLGGAADGAGVTGLAAGAELIARSPYLPEQPALYNPAAAIARAAAELRAGDVLLVEQQGDLDPDPARVVLGPPEASPSMAAAIRAAVAAGIVVVEPAGNGASDLGAFGLGREGDSGAIIAAAGRSGFAIGAPPERARVASSNHGVRVDLQGPGEAVVTAGYGDLIGGPAITRYTACFDQTSAAAAGIAAAAAVLQGVAITRTGAPLAPVDLRARLVASGLPQPDPQAGPIGPRPRVALAVAGLPAGPPAVGGEAAAGPSEPAIAEEPPPTEASSASG